MYLVSFMLKERRDWRGQPTDGMARIAVSRGDRQGLSKNEQCLFSTAQTFNPKIESKETSGMR